MAKESLNLITRCEYNIVPFLRNAEISLIVYKQYKRHVAEEKVLKKERSIITIINTLRPKRAWFVAKQKEAGRDAPNSVHCLCHLSFSLYMMESVLRRKADELVINTRNEHTRRAIRNKYAHYES